MRRIGLIVPSSNTTMETELPELLARHEERFTWHSARVRMKHVTPEELDAMVQASDVAALALADAPVEAIAYACLVAVMCRGAGAHRDVECRLAAALDEAPRHPPVVSSAGALIGGLHALGARRVAMITPYVRPLADEVAAYVRSEGIEVTETVALEVADNVAVGRLDPAALVPEARRVAAGGVDAIVLSACVQMPSLPVVQRVEDELGVPVLTAATATARALLLALGLEPVVPAAGRLLAAQPGSTDLRGPGARLDSPGRSPAGLRPLTGPPPGRCAPGRSGLGRATGPPEPTAPRPDGPAERPTSRISVDPGSADRGLTRKRTISP